MPASKQQEVDVAAAAASGSRDLYEDIALAQGTEPSMRSEGAVLIDGDYTVDDVLDRSQGSGWDRAFVHGKEEKGLTNKAACVYADRWAAEFENGVPEGF
jgi:hypothetical protein